MLLSLKFLNDMIEIILSTKFGLITWNGFSNSVWLDNFILLLSSTLSKSKRECSRSKSNEEQEEDFYLDPIRIKAAPL